MPKITINEVNATSPTPMGLTSGLPVAIIGAATKGALLTPVYINSVSEFYDTFGSSAPTETSLTGTNAVSMRYGHDAAIECLAVGNPVLYTRLGNSDATAANGVVVQNVSGTNTNILSLVADTTGTDGNNLSVSITSTNASGTPVYTANVYNSNTLVDTGTFVQGLDTVVTLLDVGGVTISKAVDNNGAVIWTNAQASTINFTGTNSAVVLTGGVNGDTYSTVTAMMTNIQTALTALEDTTLNEYVNISIPGLTHLQKQTESNIYVWSYLSDLTCGTNYTASGFTSTQDKEAIIDCSPLTTTVTTVLSSLGMSDDLSLGHLAVFAPWYTGTLYNSSTSILLPPSIAYLRAFCIAQADGYPCRAIAGSANGNITSITSTAFPIGANLSQVLSDDCVNPICYHRALGFFFDGNSVYNPVATSETYQQLSVRYTIDYIKKELSEICTRLSYAPNSTITRTNFMGEVTAVLDRLKINEFLYAYNVVISSSETDISNGILTANVSVFPTPALEEFNITLKVVNTTSNL